MLNTPCSHAKKGERSILRMQKNFPSCVDIEYELFIKLERLVIRSTRE